MFFFTFKAFPTMYAYSFDVIFNTCHYVFMSENISTKNHVLQSMQSGSLKISQPHLEIHLFLAHLLESFNYYDNRGFA